MPAVPGPADEHAIPAAPGQQRGPMAFEVEGALGIVRVPGLALRRLRAGRRRAPWRGGSRAASRAAQGGGAAGQSGARCGRWGRRGVGQAHLDRGRAQGPQQREGGVDPGEAADAAAFGRQDGLRPYCTDPT